MERDEMIADYEASLRAELNKLPPLKYEPLPSPTCIRLIQRCKMPDAVRRATNEARSQDAYVMRVFELDDAPAYEALSYTWGDPLPPDAKNENDWGGSFPACMFVNGSGILIGSSLRDALWLTRLKVVNDEGELGGDRVTPFHLTARRGSVRDVRRLLDAGADVASTDRLGRTALHYVAAAGNVEVVKELTKPEYMYRYLKIMKDGQGERLDGGGSNRRARNKADTYLAELSGGDGQDFEGWWWVDAVCIDQANLEERASQVRLMSRIYSSARHVHVSLSSWSQSRYPERPKPGWEYREQDPRRMTEVIRFLRRRWFTRSWIVQELVLSTEVTFHVEQQRLSYEEFEKAMDSMASERQPPGSTVEEVIEARRAIRQGECLRNLRSYFQKNHRRAFTLYSLLVNCAISESMEPRDKIFSLLNLVRNEDGQYEKTMTVDYTNPLCEIYTTATRQALKDEEDLSPLCWASTWFQGHKGLDGLPSWVPPYHLFSTVRGPDTALDGYDRLSGLNDNPKHRCFSASGRLKRSKNEQAFEGTVDPYSPELEINGVRVDRIRRVCETSGQKIRFEVGWLELINEIGTASYPNGDPAAKALMLTSFAGKYGTNSVFGKNTSEAVWSSAEEIWQDLICNSVAVEEGQSKEKGGKDAHGRDILTSEAVQTLENLVNADGKDFAASPTQISAFQPSGSADKVFRGKLDEVKNHVFGESLVSALGKRVMFSTEKGYLGLAPIGAQAGDEVWVLPALNVPVIFRKSEVDGGKGDEGDDDPRYRHIGETYVHGIMFGEAVPDAKIKLKSVVLV